ncbi:MAG: hypothetical protein WDO19_28235 [Bacteroidota bacterium]
MIFSPNLPPIGDQGRQSSCVAWSIGYALKAFEEKIETKQLLLFSPSFIYNQLNNGQDGGINIIEALNLVSHKPERGYLKICRIAIKSYTSKPSKTASDKHCTVSVM